MSELDTAIVRVQPQTDKSVTAFYEQALGLQKHADALVIRDNRGVADAANDLSLIGGIKKAIEEKRKSYTKPLNDHLASVNDTFKAFTEPLNSAEKTTKDKLLAYDAKVDRRHQEQEEINRLRMEAAQKEMELKGELTESVDLVEVEPEAPSTVRTDLGTVATTTIWDFEVEDFALVSDEYKLIDASKVGKVVRAGLRAIPGIRIYSQKKLRTTPRNYERRK